MTDKKAKDQTKNKNTVKPASDHNKQLSDMSHELEQLSNENKDMALTLYRQNKAFGELRNLNQQLLSMIAERYGFSEGNISLSDIRNAMFQDEGESDED
tara:strand:+ start:404 stop:700 length:297 start_codon:yes stop_codon:yes gene_type:complete